MNPRIPQTWDDLATRPAFGNGRFDPKWYDGDVDADLFRLRQATITILDAFSGWTCELVVLDDCTMYVRFDDEQSTAFDVYPSVTDNDKPCFFLDFDGYPTDEIRVETPAELIRILRELRKE